MRGETLRRLSATVGLGACLISGAALAAAPGLTLHVDHLSPGGTISTDAAFCVATAKGHVADGPDISPSVSWSAGPAGTRSYALILTDIDAPAAHRGWMNSKGRIMTNALRRRMFYHWVLADIPADVHAIAQGAASATLVPHGKPATVLPIGMSGLNSYTQAFAQDGAMKGQYFGYDGPCPPWNDIAHRYIFTVYALSVAKLGLPHDFTGPDALAAMRGKILATGEEPGIYTTNPAEGARIQPAQR